MGPIIAKKPWFCHEVKELLQQKKKSYLIYRSSPTCCPKVRNRINARIKAIKRDYWAKFTSDMEHRRKSGRCSRTGKSQ